MIEMWRRDDYEISTDPARLDLDVIHGFLTDAYWCKGISRATIKQSIDNSMNFGLYHQRNGQVGYARVISDQTTFAWLGDVFVIPEERGKGLGVWLVESLFKHPNLQNLRRWLLATGDAHTLYRRFGFIVHPDPGSVMTIHDPDVHIRLAEIKEPRP